MPATIKRQRLVTALEAPKPQATPEQKAQESMLRFQADEIIRTRDNMLQAVNKAGALFSDAGPAENLIRQIYTNIQSDLSSATPETKYALEQAMNNWREMGTHWMAIATAVRNQGTQVSTTLKEFSDTLQRLVTPTAKRMQAQGAFNAEEFEATRQQLVGAYKVLQQLFEDADLTKSMAAIKAELNTQQKMESPDQRTWQRAFLLWRTAIDQWNKLKEAVGTHPIDMNAAMKRTFQFWNSVASGKPAQPAQKLPAEQQMGEPSLEELIAVMREKAKREPAFAAQFEQIVKNAPPEKLKQVLQQQLLGRTSASINAAADPSLDELITMARDRAKGRGPDAVQRLETIIKMLKPADLESFLNRSLGIKTPAVLANVRLAKLMRLSADGTFDIPGLMLTMQRYYEDTRRTFRGGKEMPELQPHILKTTEVLNDKSLLQQQPRLKAVADAWNNVVNHWLQIDKTLEEHGKPMKESLNQAYTALKSMLSAEEPKQLHASVITYKGARYVRID